MPNVFAILSLNRLGAGIALVMLIVGSTMSEFFLRRLEQAQSLDAPIESLPVVLGSWRGVEATGLTKSVRDVLQLSRFIKRDYFQEQGQIATDRSSGVVSLYIGYWRTQTGEYQAAKHSPQLCLPSNGWKIQQRDTLRLTFPELGEEVLPVKRLVGEYAGRQFLFYYWFFSGSDNYVEELQALLKISLQKIRHGRSDGGIVELSTPFPSGFDAQMAEEKANQKLQEFALELYPALRHVLTEAER